MEKPFNRSLLLFSLAGFLSTALHCPADSSLPREFAGATPLQWSVRMADSEMARRGDNLVWKQGGTAKWDYTVGLFTLSLLKLDEQVHHPDYVKFAENTIGSFITPDGGIQGYKVAEYQLDAINPGKTVLALWQITHDERYQKAAALLRRQLDTQPRTARRRVLAQATVSAPDVAGRPVHGRAVLCRVCEAVQRAGFRL